MSNKNTNNNKNNNKSNNKSNNKANIVNNKEVENKKDIIASANDSSALVNTRIEEKAQDKVEGKEVGVDIKTEVTQDVKIEESKVEPKEEVQVSTNNNILPSTVIDEDEPNEDYSKPTKRELEYIKAYKNKEFAKEDFGVQEWLDTDKLKIDKDTQRNVNLNQVTQIIKDFNPSSFGRIAVSKREDGYFVTNGQHRLLACKKIGIPKVPCIVTINECKEEKDMKKQDAKQFLEINQNVTAVRAIDKYRIGVSAQMEDWLRVKDVIETNGLRAGTTVNSINAIACIYRYINSPSTLDTINNKKRHMKWAIKVLKDTVGVGRITNVSLQAMCIIIREYVEVDLTTVDKLISRLKEIKLDGLISTAITMKNSGTQKNVVSYLAFLIVQEYNKKTKRKEEKLPIDKILMAQFEEEEEK